MQQIRWRKNLKRATSRSIVIRWPNVDVICQNAAAKSRHHHEFDKDETCWSDLIIVRPVEFSHK